jgi:branched-chain amino acid transport system substrate-binding protein
MLNFGANIPETWQTAPTSITCSLNFAFHTKLTGKLAAQETNKQCANTVSYYDGGYGQCFTMLTSHQQNGGVPRFNHVTQLQMSNFTLEPLAQFLAQNADVQTLLCLFSGDEAVRFYTDVKALMEKHSLALYVSPMMLDDVLKPLLDNDFTIKNVKGFIPWHTSLKNDHNTFFNRFYFEATGQHTNYFSLLGWDAGAIVKEIYEQHQSAEKNATAIIKSLTGKKFDSPRGWIKFDKTTHQIYGPSYTASLQNGMEILLGAECDYVEIEWNQFTKETMPPGESSSWRNSYLCI